MTLDDSLISRVADRVREAQASRARSSGPSSGSRLVHADGGRRLLLVMLGPPMARLASGASGGVVDVVRPGAGDPG